MFCFTTSGFSLKNFRSIMSFPPKFFCSIRTGTKNLSPLCQMSPPSLTGHHLHMGRKVLLPRCHPSCHRHVPATSQTYVKGYDPRSFHCRLQKWKDSILHRFAPPTGSLSQSSNRSFLHRQFFRYYIMIIRKMQG